jgi:hypothetical protein
MRTASVRVRRAIVMLVVLGVVGTFGWLLGGEASPFHQYFLYHVTWPNRLMALNLPAFMIAAHLGGNLHAPPVWALWAGFLVQWLPVAFFLSLIVVRPSTGARR